MGCYQKQKLKSNIPNELYNQVVYISCSKCICVSIQVDPTDMYNACVKDLCSMPTRNMKETLCEAIEAYADECREEKFAVNWRSRSLCREDTFMP